MKWSLYLHSTCMPGYDISSFDVCVCVWTCACVCDRMRKLSASRKKECRAWSRQKIKGGKGTEEWFLFWSLHDLNFDPNLKRNHLQSNVRRDPSACVWWHGGDLSAIWPLRRAADVTCRPTSRRSHEERRDTIGLAVKLARCAVQ